MLPLVCLAALAPPTAEATFSGKPGLIVFSLLHLSENGAEPSGGLYAIRPGQEHPRQLTANPRDYDPSFEPSGRRLVFRRSGGSGEGIYMLDLQTGRTRQVASHQGDQSPAFGPDGMIVVSRFIDGSYDLVLYDRDGKVRRLTSDDGRDLEAVFTPDGERIVFLRDYRKIVALSQDPSEKEGIYSIRVDGTGQKFLRATRQGGFDFDLSPNGHSTTFNGSFSPDGRKLAYADHNGLWLRRSDGRGKPTLILGAEYNRFDGTGELLIQPAWQPLPRGAKP